MQPRLTRSTRESIIGGVCGGLGEYFNIDPIIVRLIFVLVTLTSGVGLPVYILLWLLMPKDTKVAQQMAASGQPATSYSQPQATYRGSQTAQDAASQGNVNVSMGQPAQTVQHQQQAAARTVARQAPPPPSAYKFDPQTGKPIEIPEPSTGETIRLEFDPPPRASVQYTPQPGTFHPKPPTTPLQQRNRNWRKLGIILVGMGGLVLLNQLGVSMGLIVPPLMIVAGLVLLKRKD